MKRLCAVILLFGSILLVSSSCRTREFVTTETASAETDETAKTNSKGNRGKRLYQGLMISAGLLVLPDLALTTADLAARLWVAPESVVREGQVQEIREEKRRSTNTITDLRRDPGPTLHREGIVHMLERNLETRADFFSVARGDSSIFVREQDGNLVFTIKDHENNLDHDVVLEPMKEAGILKFSKSVLAEYKFESLTPEKTGRLSQKVKGEERLKLLTATIKDTTPEQVAQQADVILYGIPREDGTPDYLLTVAYTIDNSDDQVRIHLIVNDLLEGLLDARSSDGRVQAAIAEGFLKPIHGSRPKLGEFIAWHKRFDEAKASRSKLIDQEVTIERRQRELEVFANQFSREGPFVPIPGLFAASLVLGFGAVAKIVDAGE